MPVLVPVNASRTGINRRGGAGRQLLQADEEPAPAPAPAVAKKQPDATPEAPELESEVAEPEEEVTILTPTAEIGIKPKGPREPAAAPKVAKPASSETDPWKGTGGCTQCTSCFHCRFHVLRCIGCFSSLMSCNGSKDLV